ncbi:formate dehydrogenase subunit gamma [Parapusillimonas granuli]|uniref:Formate dehydrogenase subunit gamma n=1 Tax=Parapusillimonas granuli TaxID=380911 RepID=A0A853G4M7_9BURK|nr:formate dehydrogenase subunit gamma [Parapusillimonas granuli]MBB5215199.1 formate dehydrogenase subunit gamma [Parapusillimonas granuli]MEB2401787.1 formate dehydrogenase subunit gamma [Alcaligenaceae bacterium]NYT49516.1 formate dehydrogenase subunit gamma [Parapusillimonas granuli]
MHTPTHADEFEPSAPAVETVTRQAIARHAGMQGNLLPILHAIQHALGCIPAGAVPVLAQALQLSRAEIHGVIRFYPHFRQRPAGPVRLEICRAESCQAMGANALADHARRHLACDFHETSPDGKVTLEPVYCLGLCAQSPAVMVNGQPHARVTPQKLDRLLQAQGCGS